MILRKISPLTHNVNEMDIPMLTSEFESARRQWEAGLPIQEAFPKLNADQREFIKTGYTPEDWKKMFPEEA